MVGSHEEWGNPLLASDSYIPELYYIWNEINSIDKLYLGFYKIPW